MISVLEKWKRKQGTDKPLLVIKNTSGGGQRSATFTMNMLQHLDSITHGELMKKTFLIVAASIIVILVVLAPFFFCPSTLGARIHEFDLLVSSLLIDFPGSYPWGADLVNPVFHFCALHAR